jgi:hypothetical protein
VGVDKYIIDAAYKCRYRGDIGRLLGETREFVTRAVDERVNSALEEAILGAQSILQQDAGEYIEALFVSDSYQLEIREHAFHLEYGYDNRQGDKLSAQAEKREEQPKQSDVFQVTTNKVNDLFSKQNKSNLSQSIQDMQSIIQGTPTSSTKDKIEPPKRFVGVNQLAFINSMLAIDLESITYNIIDDITGGT